MNTVFIPGYGNSLGLHWQRLWFQQFSDSYWLEQEDWEHPNKDKWIDKLDQLIDSLNGADSFRDSQLRGLYGRRVESVLSC
ncbi:alpha/beta hydrolase [Shewanella surugensis]|uniref:alpha/beta hydrolase n=1 Tax=Shewanella surugensis TaxID=212020 RepID=UPI0024B0AB82|nr:alpha/beta hydrolase [Shewanella surugensis]